MGRHATEGEGSQLLAMHDLQGRQTEGRGGCGALSGHGCEGGRRGKAAPVKAGPSALCRDGQDAVWTPALVFDSMNIHGTLES